MIDKQVRPLPKNLSEAQKIVLASYPYARCGTAHALKETVKNFWGKGHLFNNFGKNAKWVIYAEPDNESVVLLVNVLGIHPSSQKCAWEDAAAVIGKLMAWKMEK